MRGTTAPCYSEARGVRIEHIQPSGNLWGRNDQNKLILIVRHGGETEEKMVAVFLKKKEKKRKKEKGARVVNYLDFTSFHQRTVKLLPGPLCICTRLKCYKTKALQSRAEGKMGERERDWE